MTRYANSSASRRLSVRHLAITLFASGLISGCVSFAAKAPPALLVLSADNMVKNGTAQSGAANEALIILLPDVTRKLDTNRVPVQTTTSSIAYLKDAIWADKPARLMQQLLVETISAKNGRLVLNAVDAGGKAEQFLSGTLVEFGIDAKTKQAVIIYDAVKLVRGQAVQKRRFESRQSVAAIDSASAGTALNIAANNLANDIAAWIS